jgi:hypothetical protein
MFGLLRSLRLGEVLHVAMALLLVETAACEALTALPPDEMFGRAIALTRQENTFVKCETLLSPPSYSLTSLRRVRGQRRLRKLWANRAKQVGDIQHGLALLRELLSIEHNNVSYMYYIAYGELRLGRTTEGIHLCLGRVFRAFLAMMNNSAVMGTSTA